MSFNEKHYVPILKAKAGELRALKEATDAVRRSFTPLLEITDIPPKYLDGEDDPIPSKTVDEHVEFTTEAIVKSCGAAHPMIVDGYYIENLRAMDDGREPIEGVIDGLRDADLTVIPVTGLDRTAEYNEAIIKKVSETDDGVCLRINQFDVESDDLEGQLMTVVKGLRVAPKKVDLLLDFGPTILPRVSLVPLLNDFPRLKEWRSFTLAASAIPENMSEVSRNDISEIDRDEWLAWVFLRNRNKKLLRIPTYGDYAINHPVPSELDPRMMRISGNIRYTSTTTFVIAKGEAFPRKKDKERNAAPSEQYPKLAKYITEHKAWCGADFSWGDAFIQKCANKECVGGQREWRAVGTSHHLAFVAKQIASLPGL